MKNRNLQIFFHKYIANVPFWYSHNSNFDVSGNPLSKLHVSHQVELVHSLRQSVFLHIYIAFLDILHKDEGQPFIRIPYLGKLLVLNFCDQRYNPFFQWLPTVLPKAALTLVCVICLQHLR